MKIRGKVDAKKNPLKTVGKSINCVFSGWWSVPAEGIEWTKLSLSTRCRVHTPLFIIHNVALNKKIPLQRKEK